MTPGLERGPIERRRDTPNERDARDVSRAIDLNVHSDIATRTAPDSPGRINRLLLLQHSRRLDD